MPQMAPMSWTLLMMFFSMIYITLNMMNYYLFIYKNKKSITKTKFINLNWK